MSWKYCVGGAVTVAALSTWVGIGALANNYLDKEKRAIMAGIKSCATRYSIDGDSLSTVWVKDKATAKLFKWQFKALQYAMEHPFSYLVSRCSYLHWTLKHYPKGQRSAAGFFVRADPNIGGNLDPVGWERECTYGDLIDNGTMPRG